MTTKLKRYRTCLYDLTQRVHDVKMMSYKCQCDIDIDMTSFWHQMPTGYVTTANEDAKGICLTMMHLMENLYSSYLS